MHGWHVKLDLNRHCRLDLNRRARRLGVRGLGGQRDAHGLIFCWSLLRLDHLAPLGRLDVHAVRLGGGEITEPLLGPLLLHHGVEDRAVEPAQPGRLGEHLDELGLGLPRDLLPVLGYLRPGVGRARALFHGHKWPGPEVELLPVVQESARVHPHELGRVLLVHVVEAAHRDEGLVAPEEGHVLQLGHALQDLLGFDSRSFEGFRTGRRALF